MTVCNDGRDDTPMTSNDVMTYLQPCGIVISIYSCIVLCIVFVLIVL